MSLKMEEKAEEESQREMCLWDDVQQSSKLLAMKLYEEDHEPENTYGL